MPGTHTNYTAKDTILSQHIPAVPLALYLHIPFCETRCTYCAFNTYIGQADRIPAYIQALLREIQLVSTQDRMPAHTIYFGGGTPSLVPAAELDHVLKACASAFILPPDIEITLEANPGTVDLNYLNQIRQIGVNRLSIGMQSADTHELQLFARLHGVDEVRSTVKLARAAGFENISLDLIYGVPHQTLNTWRSSVETALRMNPDHLSFYGLGVEDGTPMQRWIASGQLPPPDSDLAAEMYEWASARLAEAGYEQYEISNWARPGFECVHNVHYWRNLPYLGLGAGAHGYAAQTRYVNVLRPADYIKRIEEQTAPLPFPLSAAANEIDEIDERDSMAEMMLMSLRLTREGLNLDTFRTRYGRELWSVYGKELDRLIAYGLLELTTDARIRLTERGRMLGNYVFEAFV